MRYLARKSGFNDANAIGRSVLREVAHGTLHCPPSRRNQIRTEVCSTPKFK